jgi:hypothetical protein
LIFQLDTLLSEQYKNNIYNFLDYDYVGAPWAFNHKVGNGGLSLRKKSKMLEILNKESINVVLLDPGLPIYNKLVE